jgi:hypothetical protein
MPLEILHRAAPCRDVPATFTLGITMPRQTLYKPPHPQTEPWPPVPAGEGVLSDEPAKDVYREACARIAMALQSHKFKYLKSKQRCHRLEGRFKNDIAFQSSHFNASGRHVQLWMHATVGSPELQAWRAARLPAELVTGHVAGGMVHLLGTKFALVQWELADPQNREQTIFDAIDFIHAEVFPYFARFEPPESLASSLAVESVPGLGLVPSVEFAHCFGSKAHAQAALDRFVQERPDLHEAISAEQKAPSPSAMQRSGGYAQQVVFLRTRYGLQ